MSAGERVVDEGEGARVMKLLVEVIVSIVLHPIAMVLA